MYFASFILFLACVSIKAENGQLPSYITPCDHTSNELDKCIKEEMVKSVAEFTKGIPELDVPVLDPFHMDRVEIDQGSIKFLFTNAELYGLRNIKIVEFRLSQQGPPFDFQITFIGDLTFKSHYTADGEVLILPIKGEGPATIDVINIEITLSSSLVEKGQHYTLANSSYKYKMQKAKLDLKNLFKGNQQLSDTILQVLNDNWEAVISELASPVFDQIVKAVVKTINKFFGAIRNERLFVNFQPGKPWGS